MIIAFFISINFYYSFISLFLYKFILIPIDTNNIIIFITTVINGIPTLFIIFITVYNILES